VSTDRVARLRADLERLMREYLDRAEALIREAITEHEIDVRRETADEK
jgi:hypothetical protein